MKIAILQFSPALGQSARNFSLAESLLMRAELSGELPQDLDLLVLPELAFSGYNFPSLEAIAPFLEPTAAGPSTRWAARTARRLKCTVAVGYPEAPGGGGREGRGEEEEGRGDEGEEGEGEGEGNFNTNFDGKISTGGRKGWNSLVFVDAKGDVVAHYRKRFLYYTDESWAVEGTGDFHAGILALGQVGKKIKMAAGICMDINPYRFEAPWTMYEFANHARECRAKLVVLSMAWLTRLAKEEVFGEEWTGKPDMDTVGYWLERLRPLVGPEGLDEEVVVVCANRTGEEGMAERIGEVRYAGSSCVMGLRKGDVTKDGEVRIWEIMGRAEEGMLVVDTDQTSRYRVTQKAPAWDTSDDEPIETDGQGTVLGQPKSRDREEDDALRSDQQSALT